jgi:hypothetical protein
MKRAVRVEFHGIGVDVTVDCGDYPRIDWTEHAIEVDDKDMIEFAQVLSMGEKKWERYDELMNLVDDALARGDYIDG